MILLRINILEAEKVKISARLLLSHEQVISVKTNSSLGTLFPLFCGGSYLIVLIGKW